MGPLLSTRSAPSACLIAVNGVECFYADLSCGELVKTAPTDAMISNQSINQSINAPASSRPSPRFSCRAGGATVVLLGCGLFPVIFVYFRLAPELSISSGIMRLCCGFLLAYRAVFPFLFRHRSAWPRCSCCARSCDVIGMSSAMPSVSAACLLPLGDVPCCPSLRPSRFAPSSSRLPAPLVVSGDGEPAGLLASGGHACGVVVSVACFGCGAVPLPICRASVVSSSLLLRIGWRRERERLRCDTAIGCCLPREVMAAEVSFGFLGCGGGWCVVQCLLDVVMAGDDEMMRYSCSPCHFILLFLSPCPLSPALLDLLASACSPALRAGGCVGGCRFATAGGGVGLLACHHDHAALSPCGSFAFSRRPAVGCVVGLRLLASLLARFHHRLRCRVFSYSIPDEMMRITGSCDIRLLVPSLVSSGGSPLTPAYLMFAAVCLDASPPSSHRPRAWFRVVSLCVPRLVPLLCFAPSSISVPVLLPPHGFSLPAPPHRHDGRGDTTMLRRLSRLCLLAPRSPSHLCGSASDGDGTRCLPR